MYARLMTTIMALGLLSTCSGEGPTPSPPVAKPPAHPTSATAGATSDGIYPAHMKFESTNGGYLPCREFDVQFTVSNGTIDLVGHQASIGSDGPFQLRYTRSDGYAVNTVNGRVEPGSIKGTFLSVGRSTTCTYSFAAMLK